jgi:hypothetical protein
MKTFKQFFMERENLYNITDDQMSKKLGHVRSVRMSKPQTDFLKMHLPISPVAKDNKSLLATLNKSPDFAKVSHAISSEKK